MDHFDVLNSIYKPMCGKAHEIIRGLKAAGYVATVQFHNNHSVKRDGAFVTEHFPIPIISIDELGDIGVDIDSIWFEAALPKERALALNYAEIIDRYKIEIYGSENYLDDLFNEQIDVSKIAGNIAASPDTSICVLFYLSMDATCDELIEIARLTAV